MTQTDQQNVPKLRFSGFSEPLTSVKLGEVASFSKGKGISKNDITPDGALPCIRYGELYTVYDTIIEEPISRTDVPTSALTLSKGDEVLVPASGEDAKDIATAVVVKRSGVALGGDLNIIRSKNDGAFLASYLSGRKRMTLAAMAQGNSVVHLYPAQLKALDIHLPTLPEQRKIASFLGAVDTKIVQLSRKNSLLEDYKKGCMQQLFSQKFRFKDDDGKDFPDWKETRLGDVVSIKKGQQLNRDDMIDGAQYPVINGGTSASGYTDTFNTGGGVITISEGGNSCGYVDWQSDDFWLGGHCYALPLKGSASSAEYLLQYLKNNQASIMALRVGSGLPNIQKRDLEKLAVLLPHPDEQRKIADFLSALDRKIELVGKELEHAKTFKKGLLQQMFV